MEVTQWYAVSLGALSVLLIGIAITQSIYMFLRIHITFYFLKHVFYPQIPRCVRGSKTITRFDVGLIVIFLAANVLWASIGVQTTEDLQRRIGHLSTINFMALAFGGRMNLIANICDLKLSDIGRIHGWLGAVTVIEGLVHSLLAALHQRPNISRSTPLAGVVLC